MDLLQIEKQIKSLKLLRNENRNKLIKEISLNLHQTLKQFGYKTIERKFLKTFFDDDIKATSQNEILKSIIGFLTSKNLIEKTTIEKAYNNLRQKPLSSYMDKQGCCITLSKKSITREKQKHNITGYKLL